MRLSSIAAKLGWGARDVPEELEIGLPCFDSRVCCSGDVFWGLAGERDGGQFAQDALEKGASAVVVTGRWADKIPPGKPLIIVDDALKALTDLAILARENFKGRVFALTGSCGKTFAKDLIAAVLSQKFRVLKSPASYNNQIGVPFIVSQLSDDWDAAVLEMGANHAGEIASLCTIARPQAGLITMVGRAHLEGFGNLSGVAEAKGELFRGLTGDKLAFVNFDDPYVVGQSAGMSKRIGYGFGFPPEGQGFARIYNGTVNEGRGFSALGRNFAFPFPRFMMIHGLSAVAVGHFMGVETHKIEEALVSFTGTPGRMQRFERAGVTIYNDTYNSNPTSLESALRLIAGSPGTRRIAALGDMLELGEFTAEEHQRAISLCQDLGFDLWMTYGEEFAKIAESNNFTDKGKMAEELLKYCEPGDLLLFKGSRLMKFEEALRKFISGLERSD